MYACNKYLSFDKNLFDQLVSAFTEMMTSHANVMINKISIEIFQM